MLVTDRTFGRTVEFLSRQPRLVGDTETNGLSVYHGSRIIGVSVAPPNAKREQCFYFPFRHKPGGNLSGSQMRTLLKVMSSKLMTGWNYGGFDVGMLMADGMKEPKQIEDVMLLLHLLSEDEKYTGGSYELKVAATRYVDKRANRAALKLTELLASRRLTKGEMQELTPKETDEYASDDVFYTEKMRGKLMPYAKEWELEQIWREVNEYSLATRRFEDRGFMIDASLTNKYIKECEENCARLKRRMGRMSGTDLNLQSHKQVQRWLGLPSSAADYIDEVGFRLTGDQRKAVTALQEYRKWDKALRSYYRPFLANVDSEGVFHPNIQLHGTISGRPSTRGSPNSFALPRPTPIYKVKDVIVARPGHVLVSADYSQMELRFGAHYARDEFLIKCFRERKSPHQLMLADLLARGVDIDYDETKRVNFAVMYGTGVVTLSRELGKSEEFARMVLKEAHTLHPNYRPLLRQAKELAEEMGYVRMWTGRVRHFAMPDPHFWYHKALSNIIQGGVAEVMRHAILRLGKSLPSHSHMILQVYDQLVVETPRSEALDTAKLIKRDMTRDFPFSVPFEVEIRVGKRLGQLKEIAA